MMAFMALFWIVIVVLAVWLVIHLTRRTAGSSSQQNALDILNQRYARGEISKEEYERMKKDISGS